MPRSRLGLRGGLAALLCLAASAGCNGLLGITDVEQLPDTPDAGGCGIVSSIAQVSDATTGGSVSHTSTGNVPLLLVLLDSDAMPDALDMMLFNNMGGHATYPPGRYTLLPADARFDTCGLCIRIHTDFNASTGTFSQTYLATAQGYVDLASNDATGMSGAMHDLELRHVNVSSTGVTTDVNDGCTVRIGTVTFSQRYGAFAPGMVPTAAGRDPGARSGSL